MSFNRPGYGSSAETPPSLASVGEDAVGVADAFGIHEFAVLGTSGGGPYALATGLAAPGRVRGIGVAAGVGPWRLIDPPVPEDPERRLLALADAGKVSAALDGFLRQAETEFDSLLARDDEDMVKAFFAHARPEETLWLDDDVRRYWAADLRDALRTYDGYARDNVAWGGEWDIDPSEVSCPTWLWYGDQDRLVSLAHGHWLAERIPTATLVIREGKGHGSTSFEFWDEMFATLRTQLTTGA